MRHLAQILVLFATIALLASEAAAVQPVPGDDATNLAAAREILDLSDRARLETDAGIVAGFGGLAVAGIALAAGAPIVVGVIVATASVVSMKLLWDRSIATGGKAFDAREALSAILGLREANDVMTIARAMRDGTYGTNVPVAAPTRGSTERRVIHRNRDEASRAGAGMPR